MKQSAIILVVSLLFVVVGLAIQKSVHPWTEQRTRAITLIDAYEHYDEYGNRSVMGTAVDNKLRFEFPVSLQTKHYLQFKADGQPMQLELKTSLYRINAPGAPGGKIFLGGFLAVVGVIGAIGGIIALIVCTLGYREEKRRRERERNRFPFSHRY